MERAFIITEIQRLAIGGVAPGRLRLESEAGIKTYHWKKHWGRYNEAVKEAGLTPNEATSAYSEDAPLRQLTELARKNRRFPTDADLTMEAARDQDFPSAKTFRKLGRKAELVSKLAAFCEREQIADVLKFCSTPAVKDAPEIAEDLSRDGFVYLLKSGKHYKVGFSVHAGARERQISLQLPDPVITVHVISTDDPPGIEAYWHKRFAAKRKNGEWFDLSREDIAAFKRRKFM